MARRTGALALGLVVGAALLTATSVPVSAAVGDISTIAGSLGEGPATGVAQQPSGLVLRGASLFVSDRRGHLIRVIDLSTGDERVISGTGAPGRRGDGGPARAAGLNGPEGIDVDSAGRLYVADSYNGRIRRNNTSGGITTVAGGAGLGAPVGDGGPAVQARLDYPTDVAVDEADNLYIADYFNHRVRKVDGAGVITTVAGDGTAGFGGDGGPATEARLERPSGVATDGAGNVFVADSYNNRVRKVDAAGTITTVAGTGATGSTGDGGPATSAAVYQPGRVDLDGDGNLFVAQQHASAVRRVDPAGTITTVAGGGRGVPPGEAALGTPQSMAFDDAGNMYVAGIWFSDNRVHKVAPSGTVTTVAGNGFPAFSGDGGAATSAQVGEAPRLALGPGGDLFVAEVDNDRVRRIDGSGTISTVATADFNVGGAIAFDAAGNLFVAEPAVVRRIDVHGASTVVAGTGTTGFSGDGGPATEAGISYPSGLAFDAAGNLYLADASNDRVRRVGGDGVITTVAGGGSGPLGDGGPATAATLDLFYQSGVAVDSRGNIFIADPYHQRVRKVSPDGIISTVAGTGDHGPLGDGGPATAAHLGFPGGLALDGGDNLYVVDGHNDRVRKVDGAGVITTVAGNGSCGYSGDGGPATSAEMNLNAGNPGASTLVVDASGDLLVGEARRVRRVAGIASPVPELPATTSTNPSTSTTTSTSTTSSTSTSTTTTPTTTTTITTVAPAVGMQTPYAVWAQPASTPLDGSGTWLVAANDPVAGAGQATPAYLLGHVLGFTKPGATGTVGLMTGPAGRFALFSATGPDGKTYSTAVAFEWKGGIFYYLFVYQLAPGVWGAWVYDHAGGAWVPMGQLSLPASWGKLSPTSFTAVGWFGTAATSCSSYPRADVLVHPAIGYVGSSATIAALGGTGTTPGDCPSQVSVGPGVWVRSGMGSGS